LICHSLQELVSHQRPNIRCPSSQLIASNLSESASPYLECAYWKSLVKKECTSLVGASMLFATCSLSVSLSKSTHASSCLPTADCQHFCFVTFSKHTLVDCQYVQIHAIHSSLHQAVNTIVPVTQSSVNSLHKALMSG
jgi:hypothetical protein